ncbi:MAG: SDR family NAD(P)-dependent oxidoreductase [Flammeovirgaceae bacterium]|nr:MAG: SDR family NAD(P)-dependent oxidoreductase [Flammeovirgaceae bacterium]
MTKKTVLITGAGGNLGKATVTYFLNKGWRVIATVSPGKSMPGLVHNDLYVYAIDLTDEEAVADWIRVILSEFRQIHAALLLAGGYKGNTLADTTVADLRHMFTLNVETAWNVARPVFLHMKRGNSGRIILIGAKPAIEMDAAGYSVAYALSKAQLIKLTELISAEGKNSGVAGYCLVPSIIDTPDNRQAMPHADYSLWIKPEKMAEVMLRLCDEQVMVTDTIIKLY